MRTVLVAIAAALVLSGAAGAQLAPGDVVVTDRPGLRLWQVRPSTAGAEVFSPPPAGTNLLQGPTDVATTPDRGVYVADGNRIVAVHPDTGVQRVLSRTVLDPIGGGVDIVPLVWTGQLAGIDADQNGALWVIETRGEPPGRLWRVASGLLGWSASLIRENADLNLADNGLAVTSDDEGDANDAYFPTTSGRVLNVDVGTGDVVAIVPTGSFPPFEQYKGGIDAVGDCEDLACTVAFTSSSWLTSAPICAGTDLDALVVIAIIADVATLYDGMPGCTTAISALGASEFYTLVFDLDPFTPPLAAARVRRVFSLESGFAWETVAVLDGFVPGTVSQAVAGMDVVLAPEPGAAATAATALTALAAHARRRARAQLGARRSARLRGKNRVSITRLAERDAGGE